MFDRIETLPPGSELALLLETVDRSTLTDEQLVRLLRARNRQLAHLQAEFYADLLAVADASAKAAPSVGYEYAGDEIAAALTWTRGAADSQLGLAWELQQLSQLHQALDQGQIDLPKAKTIVYGLTGVDRETAIQVADKLLEKAERQTTGQLPGPAPPAGHHR